jgi:hypothetical protein
MPNQQYALTPEQQKHIDELVMGFEKIYADNKSSFRDYSSSLGGMKRFVSPDDFTLFIISGDCNKEDAERKINVISTFEDYVKKTSIEVLFPSSIDTDTEYDGGFWFRVNRDLSQNNIKSIKSLTSVNDKSVFVDFKYGNDGLVNQQLQSPYANGIVIRLDSDKIICYYKRCITDLAILGKMLGYNRNGHSIHRN